MNQYRLSRDTARPATFHCALRVVIAGTDFGFATARAGDEMHPDVAWAKLEALAEGAKIASRRLWN